MSYDYITNLFICLFLQTYLYHWHFTMLKYNLSLKNTKKIM